MSTDEFEFEFVTQAHPIDVSSIRDSGMKALTILAASLGWNVSQKHNQPVVLTARDGFQKRVPTNTSIRISVFQTTLASIILYSVPKRPSPELIETIIKETKLDPDHARRMRLMTGEPDAVLADRVINAETNPKGDAEWDAAVAALVPAEPIDRKPTDRDWQAWNDQLNNLPHVLKAERRGISTKITFTTASREELWWCSFPGCHTHGENLYSVRGHSRVHTTKWGSLSDHAGNEKRVARRAQAAAAKAEQVAGAIADTAIVLPPLPEESVEVVEAPYSPVSSEPVSDNLVDRYTNDALLLLDIANRFVADLDLVTDLLGRLSHDADEVETWRAKAEKYDRMMEVLGGNQ